MKKRLHHEHSPEKIQERLEQGPRHSYIRDWVYGGIDGTVTTFAIVTGVVGANLGAGTLLILGAANLFADGLSMAASNYLGTKTEQEELKLIKDYEHHQIKYAPSGEKEEIRQILQNKGFSGEVLDKAVEVITKNHDAWLEMMLAEEYGLSSEVRSAWKAGLNTYLSFIICGAIPLMPFILGIKQSVFWSSLITAITFFLIGSLKARWSHIAWWKSGLQVLFIGGLAAFSAYYIGFWLRHLAP